MAKRIQNIKSRAVCTVSDKNWQTLFVDKGVHKLYKILDEFPDSDAVKKPFIPNEIKKLRDVERAEENKPDAPSISERRDAVVKQSRRQSNKQL